MKSVASEGKGIEDVASQIRRHKEFLSSSGEFEQRRGRQLKTRIEEVISSRFVQQFWNADRYQLLEVQIPEIISRTRTPYEAAERLLKK